MINPNRSYKQTVTAVVVKLDAPDSYIPYITLQTADGMRYEGDLKRSHSQWNKIKVGDSVGFSLKWSIMADKPMISSVTRRRKSKACVLVHAWNPNGTNDIEILIDGETVESMPEALFGVYLGGVDSKVIPIGRCLKHIAVSPVCDGSKALKLLNKYV